MLKLNEKQLQSSSTKIKKDKIYFSMSKNNVLEGKINLDIIYEDKDILIINKPKGVVVHPGAGNLKIL